MQNRMVYIITTQMLRLIFNWWKNRLFQIILNPQNKKRQTFKICLQKIYCLIFYSTFTTFSISGACCLMLFSTPNFNVEKLREQAEQFPKSFTKTVLSFTSKSSISPPSLFKNGRMLSRASITRVTVSSCVVFVSIFGFGFQKCIWNYFNYFFGEQPAIVEIFTASVGGRNLFLSSKLSTIFFAVSV